MKQIYKFHSIKKMIKYKKIINNKMTKMKIPCWKMIMMMMMMMMIINNNK